MTERHALPEIGWVRAMRKYELRRRIEVLVFGAHAGQPVLRAKLTNAEIAGSTRNGYGRLLERLPVAHCVA